MNRNFERALSLVLEHEGGYVDHPRDPGGATNLGITLDTLSSWLGRVATKADVLALKVSDVGPIYRRRYWDTIEGDELPDGLDYAVFDFAVNSGPSVHWYHHQEFQAVLRGRRFSACRQHTHERRPCIACVYGQVRNDPPPCAAMARRLA